MIVMFDSQAVPNQTHAKRGCNIVNTTTNNIDVGHT